MVFGFSFNTYKAVEWSQTIISWNQTPKKTNYSREIYFFSPALLSRLVVDGCVLLAYKQYKEINPLDST